jgi:hypothetical protein
MRRTIGAACLAVCTAVAMPAAAWDYPGHRIVGAIADLVLLQHYPTTQQRVSELLEKRDGSTIERRSLSQVAVFPDCAKKGNVPFCGRPPSDEEKAYADRNPHHDKFHFTDVPLQQPTYRPGSAGTEDIDVVQMIAYAVDQLRGKHPPAKPDVSLTDAEAVWLPCSPRRRHPSAAACGSEVFRQDLPDQGRPEHRRHATDFRHW